MDDNTPDTEAIAYVTARVTIHMGLTTDGRDQVWTSIAGTTEDDDRPPLVTILGMLDMARTTAYDMYCSEDDEAQLVTRWLTIAETGDPDTVHVIPIDDTVAHTDHDTSCVCGPTTEPVMNGRSDTAMVDTGGTARHPIAVERLMDYWAHGEGALKIQWGTSGDFARCEAELSKHVSPSIVKGLCSNLHVRATGARPGHAPGETRG